MADAALRDSAANNDIDQMPAHDLKPLPRYRHLPPARQRQHRLGRIGELDIDRPHIAVDDGWLLVGPDDNLEHSQWLSVMYPRLELLRDLLAEDGSIWVTIDDNEAHYLKVVMDEVFGSQFSLKSPHRHLLR